MPCAILLTMNSPTLSAEQVEAIAKRNGWTIRALCREAEIAQSTFGRWKRGANGLNIFTYDKIVRLAETKASEVPAERLSA